MTSVELEESVLVAWDQEQQRNVKQLELMQQFFDSEDPKPEVFWRFDQGKLLDPLYVSGELVVLQQELSALAIVSPLVFDVDHEPELQNRAQKSWKRLQDTRRKALESSQRFLLFIQQQLEQKSGCDRALITKASQLIGAAAAANWEAITGSFSELGAATRSRRVQSGRESTTTAGARLCGVVDPS